MRRALKETCRVVPGGPSTLASRVPLWPLHRDRLAEGGCDRHAIAAAEASAASAVAAAEGPVASRMRLTFVVSADGEARAELAEALSSLDVPGGPRIAAVAVPAPPGLPPGAAKPADRAYWDAAMREARAAGAQQAILVDAEGTVIDGGTATVWVVLGGELLTPPAPPAVAGVARRYVLDKAPEAGLAVRVTKLTRNDLELAEEIVLTNAFGGAVAARGRGGPVAERLRTLFGGAWSRGEG